MKEWLIINIRYICICISFNYIYIYIAYYTIWPGADLTWGRVDLLPVTSASFHSFRELCETGTTSPWTLQRVTLLSHSNQLIIPHKWSNLPNKWSNLPNKWSNLPHKWSNLPNKWSNLPHKWSNLPHKWSNLPHKWSNLPNKWSNLPFKFTRSPSNSQSFPKDHIYTLNQTSIIIFFNN